GTSCATTGRSRSTGPACPSRRTWSSRCRAAATGSRGGRIMAHGRTRHGRPEESMPTEEAFIQAIIADPDDDAPRLIYADWLDERGDPRGEFIRVQCALARMDEWDPRRWDLKRREQDLLAAHKRAWLGTIAGKCEQSAF